MDPFELLKHDHETVSKLFKRIEAASGRVKLIRFRKLKTELQLHTHIEEKIFYPALKNPEESRDITLEAYEEHKVVKDLLSQLDGAKLSDQWDAKFTVLKENVEHHVDEEEGELFSKARKVLSSEKLETLGDEMAEEKKQQGGTVSVERDKPGLIKTVVSALFGGAAKKAGKKKASEKTGKAKVTKAASKKKRSGKQTTKRATTKAKKTSATKTSIRAAEKPAAKKTATKAKAKTA
jgi:hemerythrin-like domain-containing protein